jgi:hypothetical protein
MYISSFKLYKLTKLFEFSCKEGTLKEEMAVKELILDRTHSERNLSSSSFVSAVPMQKTLGVLHKLSMFLVQSLQSGSGFSNLML